MEKICPHCKKRFNAQKAKTIYCSVECARQRYHVPLSKVSKPNTSENTQAQENISPLSKLRVIKGDLSNTTRCVHRIHDLLNFTQSVFWLDKNFSEEKTLKLKSLIAEHFRETKNVDQTFRELVERTCLAKQWFEEKPYRLIPEPEEWFNIDSLEGLYFTHNLYNKVLSQRRSTPTYQYGLTVVSEAVLKYSETKNVLDIFSYRDVLIRLHRIDLLQMYFNTIMHIQFINL